MQRTRRKIKNNLLTNKLITIVLISVFIITLFYTSMLLVEKKIMPSAITIAEIQSRLLVNRAIDNAVNTAVTSRKVTSGDFYSQHTDDSGRVNQLSTNTVLINEICSNVSVDISDQLFQLEDENILLPLGLMSGIKVLSNKGPKISISLKSKGSATVDYKTHFESVGINQINYRVWLDVTTTMTIVTPLQDKDIIITRKIALVDTILSGNVPSGIYNGIPLNINSEK